MNIEECISDIIIDGLDDDIGAYWVVSRIYDYDNDLPLEDVKTVLIQIIRRVLSEGLMDIGDIMGVGYNPELLTNYEKVVFKPWNVSVDEAVERVERSWDAAMACRPLSRRRGAAAGAGPLGWLLRAWRGIWRPGAAGCRGRTLAFPHGPAPGEVCWLVNTEKGDDVARRVHEERQKRTSNEHPPT